MKKQKHNNKLAQKRFAKRLKRKGKTYTSKVETRQRTVIPSPFMDGGSSTDFVV